MRLSLLVALAVAAGCGDERPAIWTLQSPGATVEIRRSPYGFTVRDAAGAVVLRSLGDGRGDGYGALGWTGGNTFWGSFPSQGYYQFDTVFDPWRDQWEVVAVDSVGADRLSLGLAARGSDRRMQVVHSLRGSTLRVEASVPGTTPRAWSAAFESPADEAFLGFGERYNRVDQRGLSLYAWPEEGGLSKGEKEPAGPKNPWPNGETMTYYPVPFFLSSRGYGFWLDTTWRNQLEMASARGDAWRAWHIGPQLAYEIYLPVPGDPRPWPLQLIDSFTAKTGRPMVPPAWSFGPRRRIDGGRMVNGVSEIQAMRDLHLPISVADDNDHFSPDGGDVGHEAALSAWIADARRLGYKVVGYYNPYLSDDRNSPLSNEVQKGLSHRWFLRDRDGNPSKVWLISGAPVNVYTVDFTSNEATSWFQSMFKRAIDLGYAGWMYDFGEYVQPNVLTSSGVSGEEFHNRFPVVYQKAAHDALEQGATAGEWYTFVRSGYTGASQYSPMVWSGDPDASFSDAEGVPAQVRAGINAGISGVAHWGSDISGFKCLADGSGAADGELLTRWIEIGAMCSNMHDEDSCSGGDTRKASIWTSPDAQAAWKEYAGLHTRLLPYFLSLAAEAHRSGAPVIRHLFLEHPTERALAAVGDAYYLGPALLVAPIVKRGARARDLDLPPGWFLDWRDRTLLKGGARVTLPAPLDKLPLLLRDGRLVPLLDPAVETLVEKDHPGIVGPLEAATVYDVVGLISPDTGRADFAFADGSTLAATWSGRFAAPNLTTAAAESDLAGCDGCWLRQTLAPGLARVRISSSSGDVTAGGLRLRSRASRRLRWDLFLVEK